MKASRHVFISAVCLLLLSMVATEARASPARGTATRCEPYGTTNACMRKEVTNLSINFIAGVSSYTHNPVTNIGVIGWSWWTIQQTCSGRLIYHVERGPSVRYNTDYHGRMETHPKRPCDRTRVGWSLGNHDFHQSGFQHIYPPHSHSEGIP